MNGPIAASDAALACRASWATSACEPAARRTPEPSTAAFQMLSGAKSAGEVDGGGFGAGRWGRGGPVAVVTIVGPPPEVLSTIATSRPTTTRAAPAAMAA